MNQGRTKHELSGVDVAHSVLDVVVPVGLDWYTVEDGHKGSDDEPDWPTNLDQFCRIGLNWFRRSSGSPVGLLSVHHGADQLSPGVVQMVHDHGNRAIYIPAADRLEQADMVAIVIGDALGGQDLVLHRHPLLMRAHFVDLAVE